MPSVTIDFHAVVYPIEGNLSTDYIIANAVGPDL